MVALEGGVREMFWLDDDAGAAIEPQLPSNQPGARRMDDRRIISGIIHVLKSGWRWKDCPPEYGPPTTVYNRFNLWSRRNHWRKILDALVAGQWITTAVAMDGSYMKAHRCAHGGKGGQKSGHRPFSGRPNHVNPRPERRARASDHSQGNGWQRVGHFHGRSPFGRQGYDSDKLRSVIGDKGAKPVIPGRKSRKRKIRFDKMRYKSRWMVEAVFGRLKDFRRVATRHDKLARNHMSSPMIATIGAHWL
ncbi:transposase [Azospirillum sp. B510]|nr:transposase [Azospirillum sp. B510]